MNYRGYRRTAEAQDEQYTEVAPYDPEPHAPSACSYCGSEEFKPQQEDNGRVNRATCAACGGTMVSHGGQWMPDLIGQNDNHPDPGADPDSGGVDGAAAAQVKVREEDLSRRTAAAELWFRHQVYEPGEDDEHADLDSHHPGFTHGVIRAGVPGRSDPIGHLEYSAGGGTVHVHETRVHSQYRRQGVGTALDGRLHELYPDHQLDRGPATADGEAFRQSLGAVDWCRHRHAERCWLPRNDTSGGVALYQPQDRGACPWTTASMQQINCPMSEPGPMAGMSVNASITDTPELAFHFCATWRDVRAKAKRIRGEGGVQILSSLADGLTGHVHGDTGIYETQINYVPGTFKIGYWQCGCAWAAYSWGRSPAFRRFEGRMCSHALALQYEAQSRGMFGRTVQEDTSQPAWLRDKIRVRYDRSEHEHDVREASRQAGLDPDGVYPTDHGLDLARRPIEAFAMVAMQESGDPADGMRVLLSAGLEHKSARELLFVLLRSGDPLPVVSAAATSAPTAPKDGEDPPTHAGVVLKAQDTGRVLMIQRSHKDEDDPARGKWEFPGGGREDGDQHSLHSGIREFQEETGQPFPTEGHVSHVWRSGPYQGHVVVVPSEDCVDFSNGRATTNPDDPDGDDHEQSAWWHPDDARKNPALREECRTSPWNEIKKAAVRYAAGQQDQTEPEVAMTHQAVQAPFPKLVHAPIDHVADYAEHDGDLNGEDYADELAEHVKHYGIEEPLTLHITPDHAKATLHDGNHRLRAAWVNGHTHVPLWIQHGDMGSMPGGDYDGRFDHLPDMQHREATRHTADYAANDSLEDVGVDWRPKNPPPRTDPTQPENPGSTGWATGGDPPEWDNASEHPTNAPLTSWSSFQPVQIIFPEMGEDAWPLEYTFTERTAELHEQPEPALPSTDGAEETEGERFRAQMSPEIDDTDGSAIPNSVHATLERFHATAGAQALQTTGGTTDMNIADAAREHLATKGMTRTAMKAFDHREQQELINESPGARARNFADLKIAGTHYADLEDAISREQSLDSDNLFL